MSLRGGCLCLLTLTVWSILQVSADVQVMDCCLKTSRFPIPYKILCSYQEQQIQEGCLLRAVIFITMRGRRLCAPHQAHWVKHLKERLDRRRCGKRHSWIP